MKTQVILFFRKMNVAEWRLRKVVSRQGYFTEGDLNKYGFQGFWLKLFTFMLKRSVDYDFFYLKPSGERIESKYDIPKEERTSLTLCFVPVET